MRQKYNKRVDLVLHKDQGKELELVNIKEIIQGVISLTTLGIDGQSETRNFDYCEAVFNKFCKKRRHKIRMEFSKFRGKYGLRILNCTRSRIRSRT